MKRDSLKKTFVSVYLAIPSFLFQSNNNLSVKNNQSRETGIYILDVDDN